MNVLVVVMLFEVVLYTLNKELIFGNLHTKDLSGTLQIHLFGAYFGLGAATVLGLTRAEGSEDPRGHAGASSSRNSDVQVLLGTVFLWVFFPTMVAYGAPRGTDGFLMGSPTQLRMLLNTILALTASCTWTFVLSPMFFDRKFGPADIQNATIAGGVMIGVCSSNPLHPAGAIGIGMIAATVSVIGFHFIDPLFASKMFHDSLGIHNRHGLPALFGGFASVITTAFYLPPSPSGPISKAFGPGADAYAAAYPEGSSQWKAQLWGTLATLFISFFGGALSMLIVRVATLCNDRFKTGIFDDKRFWAVDY